MYALYFVCCISNYISIFQVLGKLIILATKEGQLLNKLHFQMHMYYPANYQYIHIYIGICTYINM